MMKRIIAIASVALLASQAGATTFVILPEPGSFSPPTVIYVPNTPEKDRVFVCSSMNDGVAVGCKLRKKS